MKRSLLTGAAIAALAALFTAAPAMAQDGEALAKAKNCMACHSVAKKVVGPAYKDVAAKYADDPAAAETLAGHIKNGSSGIWGPVPMPPNAVTEDEASQLADWVLSLK